MVLSKKVNRNIFGSIFGTGYSSLISLHAGAFKKDTQQNFHIKINRTFWWNSVPHDHSNAYLPNI